MSFPPKLVWKAVELTPDECFKHCCSSRRLRWKLKLLLGLLSIYLKLRNRCYPRLSHFSDASSCFACPAYCLRPDCWCCFLQREVPSLGICLVGERCWHWGGVELPESHCHPLAPSLPTWRLSAAESTECFRYVAPRCGWRPGYLNG